MDPVKLTGLHQVTYVMGCFVKNYDEALIVKILASEVQLHNMRNLFLHPNRRMTRAKECRLLTMGEMWNKLQGLAILYIAGCRLI